MGKLFQILFGPLWLLLTYRARGTRQATLLFAMAAGLEKGLPLGPLLEALADDAGGMWRYKVRGLADLLQAGVSVPDALEAIPGLFPPDVLMLARVGASTGRLTQAFRDSAERITQRTGNSPFPTGGSLLYLLAVMVVMGVVVSFIMYWIIPKFKAIFEGFQIELPAMTQSLVRVSDQIVQYFYIGFAAFILLSVVIGLALAALEGMNPLGFRSTSWLAWLVPRLKAPLILRGMSFAVEARRPIGRALAEIAARHSDIHVRRLVTGIQGELELGQNLWQTLLQARLIRRGEAAVLATAERAGNLEWALRVVADGAERRLETRLRVFAEFLKPIALLSAGAAVGFVVVGLFLPVVKIVERLS